MNHDLEILENENKKKEDYISLKNMNIENINKLNEINEEIKSLNSYYNKFKNDFEEQIKQLNKMYKEKKESIIEELVRKEIAGPMKETEKISEENKKIMKYLNDLEK